MVVSAGTAPAGLWRGARRGQAVEVEIVRDRGPATRVARPVEHPHRGALGRQVLALGLVGRVGGERVADGGADLRDLGLDRVDRRARRGLGPVQRRREDVRADVLGVDLRREPEQRSDLGGRDVGRDRRADGVDELGQLRDQRLRIGLLAQRQQDPLLARAAIEVVRPVARAGVAQRLGAAHVLDATSGCRPAGGRR